MHRSARVAGVSIASAVVIVAALVVAACAAPPGSGPGPVPSRTSPAAASSVATSVPHDISTVEGQAPQAPRYHLAAVASAAPHTVVSAHSLVVQGHRRGYLLIAPRSSRPVPLVVMLGGIYAGPTSEALRDEFLPLADRGAIALLYPAGYQDSWNINADRCCGAAGATKLDDARFVAAAVRDASRRVHAAHRYLVGYSDGGELAYRLVCTRPALFDALAAVAAAPRSACDRWPAIPVFMSFGAVDFTSSAHHDGVPVTDLLRDNRALWRHRNGCFASPQLRLVTPATITDSCDGVVVTVRYAGLGHQWPRSSLVGRRASAATLIWAFLSHVR